MWKVIWKLFSARWQTYIALALVEFEGELSKEINKVTTTEAKARICKKIQSHKKWPGTLRGIACDVVNSTDADDLEELVDYLKMKAGLPAF